MIFMYVYMNCLNISLVNGGKAGVRARADLKSRRKESRIVKSSLLGVLLSCAIAPLRAESLSGLLRATKFWAGFF